MANGSVLSGVRPPEPVNLAQSFLGGQQARQNLQMGEQQLAQGEQLMQQRAQTAERQVSRAEYEEAVQRTRIINRLARQVREIPSEQERQAFVQRLDPEMLQSVGVDPAQVSSVGLSDRDLDALIGQTQAVLPDAELPDAEDRGVQFGNINPSDYTPESLARYAQTRNFADLERVSRSPQSRTSSQRDFEEYQRLLREDPQAAETFGRQAGFLSREGQELSSFAEKRLAGANDEAVQSASASRNYAGLAQDFEQSGASGGVAAQWSERLKQITGSEDALSRFRQEYRQIRNTEAVKNLPPGVASDKDIELALSGFPQDTARPEYIAQFMRGMAKMAQARAQYNEFKAEYISREGTERGFLDAWRRQTEEQPAASVSQGAPASPAAPAGQDADTITLPNGIVVRRVQ